MPNQIKIAPSILSADLGNLNEEIESIEQYCDLIHFDVMDGHFVPNISMGSCVMEHIKSKLPIDCHLMIENPEQYIDEFARAGAFSISVHYEVCKDISRIIELIKSFDVKASIAIKPQTIVEVLDPFLNELDMVLIMSVEPGFSGQHFLDSCLSKIQYIRKKCPNLDIEVDGGINDETALLVKKAGANVLVSASYIFGAKDRKLAIEKLKHD